MYDVFMKIHGFSHYYARTSIWSDEKTLTLGDSSKGPKRVSGGGAH